MATAEVIFKIRTDSADFKSTMAQVRSELTQTGRTQSTIAKGELTARQQLAAASSLQRQRSAALISEWKKTETAAKSLSTGVQPVSTNLQKITDVMQTLARSTATIQGPLGGVASRLSSVGSIAGEAAGGLGIIGVSIGAAAVAVTALAVAFVKLTTATAEFQGKFQDLSQQVGVTVETLSTLNILAGTTGGNIDTVTGSLALFQRNLEDSHDPTSKEAKLLKELGVTSLDTETALRQTLKGLFDLGKGTKQTDAVLQLFGRSGRFVNAILKESGGDLDKATEKFNKMGLVVSTEAAVAADMFNDSLTILGEQLAAIGRFLVTDSIPVFIAFFEQVSSALSGNADDWESWGQAIEIIIASVIGTLEGFVIWMGSRFTIGLGTAIDTSIRGLLERAQQIRTVIGVEASSNRALAVATSGTGRRRGGGGGGGKRAPRDTSLRDATKAADLAERDTLLITEADVKENKRALQEQVRTIEEFTRRAIELDGFQLDAKIDRITAESNALDDALAKRLITAAEHETKQRELDIDAAKAHRENKDETFRLERERDLQISEERIAARNREEQILEAVDQRQIERTENKVDQGVLTEAEGERRIAEILDQGFERRKTLLEEESDAYSTSLERRKDITAELIRLDGERVASAEDAARRIFEAENEKARGATRNRRAAIDDPENTGAVNQLFEAIDKELTGNTQTAALAGLEALTTAFQGVGQAVGQVVEAFVLYGNAGASIRKVTAQILASAAQQAAVKAVFELAEGFAALALAFFGIPNAGPSASAHFAAAAIYATIAGGAALAGRAVAGNSFNQAGESGGGETQAGGPEARREPPEVRDINRRGGQAPINVQVVVVGEATEGFRYVVERAATQSVRSNGVFRKIQNGEDV